MDMLRSILMEGFRALLDYLFEHALTCLVPAFFVAGAISSFVSKESVMRYFGPDSNRILSYSVASVSGAILAVCSCTVLPLFGGIYRRGAGLGPAVAFLFSGPAINILAIIYTARLLGWEIGLARAVLSILFAILIGATMALVFKGEDKSRTKAQATSFGEPGDGAADARRLVFIFLLIGVLVTATLKVSLVYKVASLLVLLVLIVYTSLKWFNRNEVIDWLVETWTLARMIIPVLLIGIFFAGALKALLPPKLILRFLGNNSLSSNLIASISGALMYFATLTEVPIIRALLDLGMNRGPALALLLSGPALSVPSMLVLGRILGVKKAALYIVLVVFFSTVSGLLFGRIIS